MINFPVTVTGKLANLISEQENISNIEWTVYGKISRISKPSNFDLRYTYDAAGNRISKKLNGVTTWYVRDASGNVMSVYSHGASDYSNGQLSQIEVDLYGSSRLGISSRVTNMESEDNPGIALEGLGMAKFANFNRRKKFFELGNHLGNVLATVSDAKRGVSGDGSLVDRYESDVVSASDYYPFGMLQPDRSWDGGKYRYGFNGMEKNDEIKGEGNSYTATFWEYDPRIGRRWNLDPVVKNWQSSYSTFSDNPVNRIDPNGDDDYFNTKGQILKRTNTKTSNIYVQTAEGVKLLSELNLKLAANRQTVANIVGHYAKEIGVDFQRKEQGDIGKGYVGVKDKGDKHAIAFASGKDIYVNINGFELPKGLDNINFLKNVLVHKNGHKKDFIANEPRSYLLHAKVYLNQITDPSFDKVPKEQQLGTLGSFANHLLNYYANEELNGFGPGIEKLIDEFNNKNPAGY